MAGTVALLLWHNSAWLTGALRQARAANQALRHARQQVTAQAAQLQASRDRVVAAADAERRRIQRDLHDGAQQSLLAAAVTARLARQHWDTSPARTADLLGQLRAELDQAATDLRRLAHGIYPPTLTDLGLPAALTAAAARCPRPVTVHAGITARYPPAVEAAIYFCCLEALQNAAKHAGDHARITVTLRHDTSGLACEVTDDGAGFTGTSAGAGLANMADRIAAVGGQLRIDSAPGRGTTVRASAPALGSTGPGTAGQPGVVTRRRPPARWCRHHRKHTGLHPAACRWPARIVRPWPMCADHRHGSSTSPDRGATLSAPGRDGLNHERGGLPAMTIPATVSATAATTTLPDHRIHDLASFNQTTGEGHEVAGLYFYQQLDCLVDLAYKVSCDFFKRPHLYITVDGLSEVAGPAACPLRGR